MKHKSALWAALLLVAACTQTPSPTLSVSPGNQTVNASSAPIVFTATLTNSTATINWSLDPASGVGSITPSSGTSTTYTPPASVGAATPVTLTASAAGVSKSVIIIVNPAPDNTPPSIVSVSPANGANGIANDSNIVITFSEPMNKAATQAAYQSADSGIRPSQVTFSWNTEGTQLTVDPNGSLGYNSGNDPAVVTPRTFTYQVTNAATDVAGNSLTTATFTFQTLRRIVISVPGLPALTGEVRADGDTAACGGLCVGDSGSAANAQYKGFFSFNLAGIPAGAQISDATLSIRQKAILGTPYATLGGSISIDHVNFATLNLGAFNVAALRSMGVISNNVTLEYKDLNVLTAVQDDYANRAARGNRSQFRAAFPTVSDFDGTQDLAVFADVSEADPSLLTVQYLIP